MGGLQAFNNREVGAVKTIEQSGSIQNWERDGIVTDGYTNPSKTRVDHCQMDLFHQLLKSIGRIQQTRFSPEAVTYALTGSPKLSAARRFIGWVHDEAVVSTRSHGIYAIDKPLQNDVFFELRNGEARYLAAEQVLAVTVSKRYYHEHDFHTGVLLTTPVVAKGYRPRAAIEREIHHHESRLSSGNYHV